MFKINGPVLYTVRNILLKPYHELNCLLEMKENMAQKESSGFINKFRHNIIISDIWKTKDFKRRSEMVLVQW